MHTSVMCPHSIEFDTFHHHSHHSHHSQTVSSQYVTFSFQQEVNGFLVLGYTIALSGYGLIVTLKDLRKLKGIKTT